MAALLDLALEVLTLNQEGGEAVGAQLVQDAGDELGEFLLLAVAVEGVGVGGDGGVDWSTERGC